jgi:hypothetical protein
MKAIRIYSGEGIYSPEALIELASPMIKQAKEARQYLFRWNTPKWYLSEVYGYLKHSKDLPELSRERKLELWAESGKDKLLYLSLYLIEVI